VESELRSIGQMARASGLTVSALRFYDGADVLVPARVDPRSGYRWYAEEQVRPARLLARLRRVGMPLADIVDVLRHWPEPVAVRGLLQAHLRRLHDGLADARRELSRVESLLVAAARDAELDHEEYAMTIHPTPTRLVLRGDEFVAALDAVRFAVGRDPEIPMLGGVLLEVESTGSGAVLRLVATDRYRLASSALPAHELSGEPFSLIAPAWLVDDVRAMVHPEVGDVEITADAAGLMVAAGGRRVGGEPLDHDFPDYRRLLRGPEVPVARRATVDVGVLRRSLAAAGCRQLVREQDGATQEVTALTIAGDGTLTVSAPEATGAAASATDTPEAPATALEPAAAGAPVGVNREFLLEAIEATGRDQLVLELDGPIRPLAVRVPGDERTFSILMPIRL
jgi:DNA-binding transcriptional MerR regulator